MFVASFKVFFIISFLGVCTGESQLNTESTDIPETDLIVELAVPRSRIRGHALLSAKGKEFYAFQEIPYAEPPIGQNRFKAPVPHRGWHDILNTTANTKICYQCMNLTVGHGLIESEDCLFLNVYTPVKPGSRRSLSVYVFIHGGAFAIDEATIYSHGPKYLIDGDIILVTMNYRLGPFGFLSTGDNVISGNMGLKDQLLAIEWTHKNIHLFGGNPQDIVVGGESAGSFSNAYHYLNPRSKGLVSAFIQQSGSSVGIGAFLAKPRHFAFALGEILDQSIDSDNTSSLLDVLQRASGNEIAKATFQIPIPPITIAPFAPVLENEDADQPIITKPMHEAFMNGDFIRVPDLIGFNSEESTYQMASVENLLIAAARYDADPSLLIDDILNVENKTLVGTKVKALYTSSSFVDDLYANVRYNSDREMIVGTIRQAELVSKHVPVYLYELSAGNSTSDIFPGIGHSIDLGYFFDFDGNSADEAIREVMLRLWWNFIKYKNPTPVIDPVLQNIKWPTVRPDNIRYLNINYTLSIETNPRNYTGVRDVLLEYIRPPYFIIF